MTPCKHGKLEHVGDQKTDDGVNAYFRCTQCKALMVATPGMTLYSIPAA